jgi:hypothetical protein
MLTRVTTASRTRLAPNYPLKRLYAIALLAGVGSVVCIVDIFDSPRPLDGEEYERSNHWGFISRPPQGPLSYRSSG